MDLASGTAREPVYNTDLNRKVARVGITYGRAKVILYIHDQQCRLEVIRFRHCLACTCHNIHRDNRRLLAQLQAVNVNIESLGC